MIKIYTFAETQETINLLSDLYESILAALRHENPSAMSLIENNDYSQLHDALSLIKLKQIEFGEISNNDGRYISLKIKED